MWPCNCFTRVRSFVCLIIFANLVYVSDCFVFLASDMIHLLVFMGWTSTLCLSALVTVLLVAEGASPVLEFSTGSLRKMPWNGSRSNTRELFWTRPKISVLKNHMCCEKKVNGFVVFSLNWSMVLEFLFKSYFYLISIWVLLVWSISLFCNWFFVLRLFAIYEVAFYNSF